MTRRHPYYDELYRALQQGLKEQGVQFSASFMSTLVRRVRVLMEPDPPVKKSRIQDMGHPAETPSNFTHHIIYPAFKPSFCSKCEQRGVSSNDRCPGMIDLTGGKSPL